MEEFFGFGGYKREAEGFLSFEHIFFVTILMSLMTVFAIYFGLKNKNKELKYKNRVLIWTAILIDLFEIFKIVILCFRGNSLKPILMNLPLFLCSIQLITIPLAAFSKGRIKEASLDFVLIFGLLGAVLGTYGAGNNYSVYPVLSLDNVFSGITHSISGFTALYIGISGLNSLKKENIVLSFLILIMFCVFAYIADILIPYNYMFLMRGDGTPYDIFYNLVDGNKILYPVIVVGLFLVYISIFYGIYFIIRHKKNKKESI